ncbi:MAG TPA: hypothetical protein VHC67_08530 [Gaiellaceae bacterium]|jgi:hypothetical protein|nr:hypothetical protein [Gaiellaceae bacterium]
MSTYGIVLFIHLSAAVGAFAANGVLLLVLRRIRAAQTGAEALPWLAIGKATARAFPPALLLLFASGAYLVHDAWTWRTGWIDAGIAGAIVLPLVGDRLEGRAAARLAQALAAAPQEAPGALVRDPMFWTASLVNPALALGIVFVMATKPSLAGSIAALLVAVALGALAAVPLWRSPQAARALAAGAEPN